MNDFKIQKIYECPKLIVGKYQRDGQDIFLIKDDDYVECLVFNSDTGLFYVIQQFRFGINHDLNEFVGGGKNRSENPYEAIKRELREELGMVEGVNYQPEDLKLLSTTFLNPSISPSRAFLFVLTVSGKHQKQNLGAGEKLLIRQCTRQQIQKFVDNGITTTTTKLLWSIFNENTQTYR